MNREQSAINSLKNPVNRPFLEMGIENERILQIEREKGLLSVLEKERSKSINGKRFQPGDLSEWSKRVILITNFYADWILPPSDKPGAYGGILIDGDRKSVV